MRPVAVLGVFLRCLCPKDGGTLHSFNRFNRQRKTRARRWDGFSVFYEILRVDNDEAAWARPAAADRTIRRKERGGEARRGHTEMLTVWYLLWSTFKTADFTLKHTIKCSVSVCQLHFGFICKETGWCSPRSLLLPPPRFAKLCSADWTGEMLITW